MGTVLKLKAISRLAGCGAQTPHFPRSLQGLGVKRHWRSPTCGVNFFPFSSAIPSRVSLKFLSRFKIKWKLDIPAIGKGNLLWPRPIPRGIMVQFGQERDEFLFLGRRKRDFRPIFAALNFHFPG